MFVNVLNFKNLEYIYDFKVVHKNDEFCTCLIMFVYLRKEATANRMPMPGVSAIRGVPGPGIDLYRQRMPLKLPHPAKFNILQLQRNVRRLLLGCSTSKDVSSSLQAGISCLVREFHQETPLSFLFPQLILGPRPRVTHTARSAANTKRPS